MSGTSHAADRHTFYIISRSVLLRMRNVSETRCRENQNTYFVFSNLFFEIVLFNEIMWKIVVERGRPQMTIWRMLIDCWIPKATNTHSEYVTHCFIHCNSGCSNAPHCYVISTFPFLL
jgi:hypothetical protein